MLSEKLSLLPDKPGCYLMKDKNNNIIYVGKAKNLKNRVRSYFVGSHNAKTTLLVSEICDFEYVTTSSELEAFILEINLIKKHDPKYNIRLTDDKTYPYIVLSNSTHPRLYVSRNVTNKKDKKFGPYPSVFSARETVRLLNNIYPLRKCINIPKKECLYYHMKQCFAPCINKVDSNCYTDIISSITSFLRGNVKKYVDELTLKMSEYSENLEFEQALECKNLIEHIKKTVERQKIELNDYVDRDIIGYYGDENDICIHMFFMRGGAIVKHNTEIFNSITDYEEMVINYLAQYYENNYIPREILTKDLNIDLISNVVNTTFIIPQKGDKNKLVELAFENAKMDLLKNRELYRNKEENKIKAVNEIKILLGLDNLRRMEIFDNSNINGINPVSAMVCYIDGKPSKKDYRKYKVKTVVGANDYETMKEIVSRRYTRVIDENLEAPDLIIMDGGVIQVNAAKEIIHKLGLNIPIIGLEKDQNHKTKAIIYNDKEYLLDKHSLMYQLLFNMQEEVHRFAISFHRDTRSKGMISSILDDIEGIGKIRKTKILKYFNSIENISNGTKEEFHKLGINESLMDEIKSHITNHFK